ncbi:hypothetical protein BEP19_16205 [Ammoniphilus oxalaticus]|uniref:Uncharacterized protein n=1 Tax=Ammoniphilus oxalaticus TaxID=66863 RepID=A0A419SQJ9_9BACL|nr:gamma-glutamyl-gamma-aminobutyrate hydrolase family protein [Ammoniphilus oxalaticus]RKD26743.1 hypothetical protein BEP19_16205 [Ammoniphilus oxalaticus]
MMPLIGVSASLEGTAVQAQRANIHAIEASGGVPIVIPYMEHARTVETLAENLAGLLLTGGGDIDPFLFGEEPRQQLGSITPERDWLEAILIKHFLKAKKPILGICRGAQILNVVAGGGMYQDIYEQHPGELLQHSQQAPRDHLTHSIEVKPGTLLHEITGNTRSRVNSFHHQAVNRLAPGFISSAVSADGIIEAFESEERPFVVGVQWHPEDLFAGQADARRLFAAFVEQSKKGP